MRIKNLTSKLQEVKLEGFLRDFRPYTIYLEPFSITDIEGHLFIPNIEELKGIIEILDIPNNHIPVISENINHEECECCEECTCEEEPAPEVVEDSYICDVCGAEFASARGLTSHKARSHSEEEQ